MIRTLFAWFCAFCKSNLKRPVFCIMLILFPLSSIFVSFTSKEDTPLIRVALYTQAQNALAQETIQSLTDNYAVVDFYKVDSIQKLQADVRSSKAECGYVFTQKYNISSITDPDCWNDSIRVIKSSRSILCGSINELVFADIFHLYCRELLKDYVNRPHTLTYKEDLKDAASDAVAFYQKHCSDNSTFQIEIANADRTRISRVKAHTQHMRRAYISTICRGLFSIWLLLTALSAGCRLATQRRHSLFSPLPVHIRPLIELQSIAAPVLLISLSGLIGMLFLPVHRSFWIEAAALFIYALLLCISVWFLIQIPKADTALPVLLPFILIGSLVFTPVFLDLSAYIPLCRIPKYLFLNTYYLLFFA